MQDFSIYRNNVEALLGLIKKRVNISEESISDLLQNTHALLGSEQESDYNLCLSVICHVAEKFLPLDPFNEQLLDDCIQESRVYLYQDMLKAKRGDVQLKPISFLGSYSKSFYEMPNTGTILTKNQKQVYDEFTTHRKIVLSAPTSFGKTRILEEILANNDYKLCVLIFPTIALLAEQFKKLKNNKALSDYHVSTSSKIKISKTDKRYILLFTPERLSLFLSEEQNRSYSFDFFCVDEIYKADQNQSEDRHYFFADTIYNLARHNPKADYYLIGPYISNFSTTFREMFGAKLLVYRAEVVQKDHFKIEDMLLDEAFSGLKKSQSKKRKLEETVKTLWEERQEKSLIFCGSKSNTKKAAKYAAEAVSSDYYEEKNKDLCDYISENISPKWSLVDYIKRGVAFHNSAMPRHIQELIVDAFEDEGASLHTLACTTTLTEGVNTSARNIIFFDHKIEGTDKSLIDTFVRKNIEGRAGRLSRHFIGNIYYIDDLINESLADDDPNLTVELEFFDATEPATEAIIQIEKDDLSDVNKTRVLTVEEQCRDENIPMSLIKQNKFIPVESQIALVNKLRDMNVESVKLDEIRHLYMIFELTYDFLFRVRDKDSFSRETYLIPKSVDYAVKPKSLKRMIDEDLWQRQGKTSNPDNIISDTVKFYYRYIEYAWPRYLTVFARLYDFVCSEKGVQGANLETLIARMEYGSSEQHELLLREAGLPAEIVQKVQDIFKECASPEEMYLVSETSGAAIRKRLSIVEQRIFGYYL